MLFLVCSFRDWCISRQLWWGHRIPAYLCCDPNDKEKKVWVAAKNSFEACNKAALILNKTPDVIKAFQDEDVLDTWFSSALLPFSVLGWPEKVYSYSLFIKSISFCFIKIITFRT